MGQTSQASDSIQAAICAVVAFADGVFSTLDADELNVSDEKRLTLYAYLFGGVHGAARHENLTPPQAHAVALLLFQKLFEMTPSESARVAQWCMDQAASGAPMNAAVHAGLEAFLRWTADPAAKPELLLPDTLRREE